jgi:hypothetical protein
MAYRLLRNADRPIPVPEAAASRASLCIAVDCGINHPRSFNLTGMLLVSYTSSTMNIPVSAASCPEELSRTP